MSRKSAIQRADGWYASELRMNLVMVGQLQALFEYYKIKRPFLIIGAINNKFDGHAPK